MLRIRFTLAPLPNEPAIPSAQSVLANDLPDRDLANLGTADIDWAVEGPKYRDRIFDYLDRHYVPNLKRDLVVSRMLTPFDFRDDMNSHLGSAFSLEPILTQSAWFRPHNRDAKIAGLYIVGAGTHPGAGVPGVVGSAKATASLMLADAGLALGAGPAEAMKTAGIAPA